MQTRNVTFLLNRPTIQYYYWIVSSVICNKFKLLTSRRAWLSIVPVVPWEGPPPPGAPRSTAKFLPHCVDVWTCNVCSVGRPKRITLTAKKGRQIFGRIKVHPERENSGYAYEKRAPAWRWYGAPEWLIRPWLHDMVQQHAVLLDIEQSFTEIRFDDWHFLLTNWHFLLIGNGVFRPTCYSNWPVQISLSKAKLI